MLGASDGLVDGLQRGIRQARQVPRLVKQHQCLVLQARDLVVDLLQRTSGLQYVLRVVRWVIDQQLRFGRRRSEYERRKSNADQHGAMEATKHHRVASRLRLHWLVWLIVFWGEQICGPVETLVAQPAGGEAVATVFREQSCDCDLVGFGGCGRKRERDLAQTKLEQAIAAARLTVIVALRGRARENLDLAIVEPEPPIDRSDLRLDGALVGQEQTRGAAFDDGGGDGAGLDIGQRLGCEHDASVLLAQRLEPFPQLRAKRRIVEREPALVDDQQCRPAIQASFDAMEQIGEHGGSRGGANQPLGLESRNVGLAETFGFSVQQPAPRAADTIWF